MKWLFGGLAALTLLIGGGAYAYWTFGTRTIEGLSGPVGGIGNSTEEIAEIALGDVIPGFEGYNMRARYVVAKPKGRIRIHSHVGRPAFSYIVGAPVEQYRSDTAGVIQNQPGDLTADSNIGQYWLNKTDQEARWYVVDIYKTDGNKGE